VSDPELGIVAILIDQSFRRAPDVGVEFHHARKSRALSFRWQRQR